MPDFGTPAFGESPFGGVPSGGTSPPLGPPGSNIPRASQFLTDPVGVRWADGTLFDGYVWLGIVLPNNPAFKFPWLYGSWRYQQLPRFIKVPIINGAIDSTTQAFYNSDLNPPGTKYVAYWFSSDGTLITPATGSAVPFIISTPFTTLTVPTLTLPSGENFPVPQS